MARPRHFLGGRADPRRRGRSPSQVHRRRGRSGIQTRPYDGTHSLDTKRIRVVGVLVADDDYHLYITNLPREEFLPADLATLYRCRWEVELLFRELKTQYKLDEFDTSNTVVVKILLYTAVLSLLVSRVLLDLVTEQADDKIVFHQQRPILQETLATPT